MIKIGLTSCFFYPDRQRKAFPPKTLQYMEHDMVKYLGREGVLLVLVPSLPERLLKDHLRELDGLVLHGGTDMAPASYGERPINAELWPGDAPRDAYDLYLLKEAFDQGMPILGICRGCQVLNVFFGGTLYQDIKTQRPESIQHRDGDLYDQISHEVRFCEDGMLFPIYHHLTPPRVNTVHHQGIKTLGKNLHIEAICPEDGMIEAISYRSGGSGDQEDPFVLGVQWHPEFSPTLGDAVLSPEPLWQLFREKVESYRLRKSGGEEGNTLNKSIRRSSGC